VNVRGFPKTRRHGLARLAERVTRLVLSLVLVLIILVWAVSFWVGFVRSSVDPQGLQKWAVAAGGLMIERHRVVQPSIQAPHLLMNRPFFVPDRGRWLVKYSRTEYPAGNITVVFVPGWIPAALTAIPTIALWKTALRTRRHRRWTAMGCCASCGYNRAGTLLDSACPECGNAAKSPGSCSA
jgi:hypothetical protein